jgi:hypothetical protein
MADVLHAASELDDTSLAKIIGEMPRAKHKVAAARRDILRIEGYLRVECRNARLNMRNLEDLCRTISGR